MDLIDAHQNINDFQNVYSPATILGVYANAIRTEADKKIILARGIYQFAQNEKEYNGYYYDSIKSPNENKTLKVKVPSLLRSKLENNTIYIFKGLIEKKISFSSIELLFCIDDVLQKEENQISDEEIKRFELLQRKINKGFRDFESIVKEHIYKNTAIKIANLYGNTAIVHKDFEKGIGDSIIKFEIKNFRCNFVSKIDLINTIKNLKSENFDVIALIRGGGDSSSLDIFNEPELCNEALSINQILVTALGHTVNDTLLDKIADKKFALPHDYGNSLKVWVDEAIEEQTKSKSLFIEQVKKDLTQTFHDQILTIQKQLETKNKEFETAQLKFKEMVEQNQKDKAETILAKEKSFEAGLKSLTEQLKTKDESIKNMQHNYEQTTKQQIASATIELKTKYEIANKEKEKLQNLNNNILVYILIAAVIGLLIGLIF